MIAIGLVGVGKIARDQHVPAIARSPDFELIATTSLHGSVEGVPAHPSLKAMLEEEPRLQAVALCQPPQHRHAAARAAIAAGKHVLLEKPPGATVTEVDDLRRAATAAGVTLFASWHSRHAAGVERARDWLSGKPVIEASIEWREDVRRWHPGQDWIWRPGGLGVFDPGINALSILTHVLDLPVYLEGATLDVPAHREAPIAAILHLRSARGAAVSAILDWCQAHPLRQVWDIRILTAAGEIRLSEGGNRLFIGGAEQDLPAEQEYPSVYAHFAELIRGGRSEVDLAPFALVADAFLIGRRRTVAAFDDPPVRGLGASQ